MSVRPLSGADVSASVRDTLAAHLPAQLAASDRPLPAPTSYEQTPIAEAIRRIVGSTVAVIVPGLNGEPERFADGYDLTWTVVVTVWHENTKAMPLLLAAPDYTAAIRQTLLDHCPAVASQVEWTGESMDLLEDEQSGRLLGSGDVTFQVRTGALIEYSPDTSGPVVLTTDVTVNQH